MSNNFILIKNGCYYFYKSIKMSIRGFFCCIDCLKRIK